MTISDSASNKPQGPGARYSRLPAQQSIRVFEAAARHMSFTLAGEELSMTQSGVSKQIKGLEDFLDVSLFIRDGHQLYLTEAGQRFQMRCTQALDNLQLAVNEVRGIRQRMRLQVPPTFAARWLIPRMEMLRQSLPDLELHIETTWLRTIGDRIQAESNELIIHACQDYPHNDLKQELLRQETLAILVSPEYLAKHGSINGPEDLHDKELIHTRLDGHIHWQAWCRVMRINDLDINQGYEFETLDMALSAAENGIGVVVADLLYAIDTLKQGKLVIPFTMPLIKGLSYMLLSQQEPSMSPHISSRYPNAQSQYRQWLKNEIANHQKQLDQFLINEGFDTQNLINGF